MAIPYWALVDAGVEVDIASIAGGRPPHDPSSLGDNQPAAVTRFLADAASMGKIAATPAIARVGADYDLIFLAGGHGTMWDFAQSEALGRLVGQTHDLGGIVSSICHGAAGLVAAVRANGQPLVKDVALTGFTNSEEEAVRLTEVVPFLLETRLRDLGARFEPAAAFAPRVVRDGRVITAQNPASAERLADALIEALTGVRGADETLPPVVRRTPRDEPVAVTIDLVATDPARFREHLLLVIPVTRLASGCRASWSVQTAEAPQRFSLIQAWDSLRQQQAYMAWREQRGDLAVFSSFLSEPPKVEIRRLFDI
jgi:putative intracellular protease/amidase